MQARRARIVCADVAAGMNLSTRGRRGALGAVLGTRQYECINGVSATLAYLHRSNTHAQRPYRLPGTACTRDPSCQRKSLRHRTSIWAGCPPWCGPDVWDAMCAARADACARPALVRGSAAVTSDGALSSRRKDPSSCSAQRTDAQHSGVRPTCRMMTGACTFPEPTGPCR